MLRSVLVSGVLAFGVAACGGGDQGGDDCPAGSQGCSCRDAGVCEVGLTCVDAVCTAESGQGDGDDGGDTSDPDPNYRIRGTVVDAGGSQVAEGSTVHIYKTESVIYVARDLLHYGTVDAARLASEPDCATDPNCTYDLTTVQTDATGAFFLSMDPADVDAGGDNFCVVYFDGGVEDAPLASATTWHSFTTDQREWDIGELGLWDAPTGVQTDGAAGIVTFDWTANQGPSGRVSSTDIPAYLFATDTLTFERRWRAYVLGETIVVPRGAFPNALSVAPTFQVIAASMPSGGGNTFLHRTNVKSVVGDPAWSASGGNNLLTVPGASIHQGTVGPVENMIWRQGGSDSAATDNDLGTPFVFNSDVADLYVDLGGQDVSVRILLYDLRVSGLRTAVIRLEANTGPVTTTSGWVDLGDVYRGFKEGETWIYLATQPVAELYRSFHLWTEPNPDISPQPQQPYFLTVAEIKVAR